MSYTCKKILLNRAMIFSPEDIKAFIMKVIPGGSDGKVSVYNVGDPGSIPGKIPWRRKWQPTPVFLPGKSHGQRSLEATVRGSQRVGHD